MDHVVGEHSARRLRALRRAVQSRSSSTPPAWVATAKNAGMKYIVITSKHHDGFAIYDSAVSDYDIVDRTPYKKDPIARARGRDEESRPEVLLLLLDHGLASPVAIRRCAGQGPHRGQRQEPDVARTEARVRRLHEDAAEGAGHQVRPGGALVRRRVGRLVDRGRRPGSLRLRARAQAVDHHQQPRRQGPQGHGRDEPDATASTRATSARPSSRFRRTAFPASIGKAA